MTGCYRRPGSDCVRGSDYACAHCLCPLSDRSNFKPNSSEDHAMRARVIRAADRRNAVIASALAVTRAAVAELAAISEVT